MTYPVLTLIPSKSLSHKLQREVRLNIVGNDVIQNDDAEDPFSRADGAKGISVYKGINNFVVQFNHAFSSLERLADELWEFFLERLDNINEPFYFYNPTEKDPPDPTGVETRGRYLVKLRDPNSALSREYFKRCLYRYGLEFVEHRDFVDE